MLYFVVFSLSVWTITRRWTKVIEELAYDLLICVDDLLMIVSKEEMKNTLTFLNGYNGYNFTMEQEPFRLRG